MNNLDKEELTGNNNVYDNRKMLEVTRYTKILVPAKSYDVKSDRRLLIPFTMGQKIGFVNSQGQIIVHPKYSMYYGDCYDEKDYVRVCKPYSYGFPRSNGNVSSYARPIYGLINFKGEEVLPMEYFSMRLLKKSTDVIFIHFPYFLYICCMVMWDFFSNFTIETKKSQLCYHNRPNSR